MGGTYSISSEKARYRIYGKETKSIHGKSMSASSTMAINLKKNLIFSRTHDKEKESVKSNGSPQSGQGVKSTNSSKSHKNVKSINCSNNNNNKKSISMTTSKSKSLKHRKNDGKKSSNVNPSLKDNSSVSSANQTTNVSMRNVVKSDQISVFARIAAGEMSTQTIVGSRSINAMTASANNKAHSHLIHKGKYRHSPVFESIRNQGKSNTGESIRSYANYKPDDLKRIDSRNSTVKSKGVCTKK
ncbi:hypothetical protein RDWZM_009425 [Blomia tropicalis]|uniref:Uncharacterized protein n=1 Tax=Blomia tropicalis TaxID=40697 RepID=A0A9Q0M1D7_BLOTA|nr:hypothetical protein RDWZM_009425 [Blomia tropicalis]